MNPGAAAVTVLLVDDDELVLSALTKVLRREGYRIVGTTDPTQAMDLLEREHAQVLITDVEMPHMSGIELARLVKQAHPHVARIVLTASMEQPVAVRAINDGEVFRFLSKPWDLAQLRQVLQDAVARQAEVRRHVATEALEARRKHLLEALEQEHPGITHVEHTRGAYLIDAHKVEATLDRLGSPRLTAVWTGTDTIGGA